MPGFSYGVADKDPGGYVSHAVVISETGCYSFVDPVLATAAQDPTFPVQLTSPGARFAGVWVRDASTGLVVPQFYHLWPALLATAHDAGGRPALLAAVPLAGVVSVLALCAVLRRAGDELLGPTGGLVAAGAGGLLLATNQLQVWQARYPTTEVLAQALYVGALLGVVVALRTGCRTAAGVAGLLVGVGWLNRADGLLLVLLSVGLGAALLATRRWDARATWFAVGLAVVDAARAAAGVRPRRVVQRGEQHPAAADGRRRGRSPAWPRRWCCGSPGSPRGRPRRCCTGGCRSSWGCSSWAPRAG